MDRIVPIPHDGDLLPSFNQERALTGAEIQRLRIGEAFPFHIVEGVSIIGPLEPYLLEDSLDRIVARHAGLRAGVAGR